MKWFFEFFLTLLIASLIVFSLIHFVPGDPAQAILGEKATPEAIEAIRHELGLNDPLPEQLLHWWGRLLQGDLGRSIRTGHPVINEIKDRLPATIELSLLALFFATFIGIGFGMCAARKPGGLLDLCLGSFSVLGLSLPIFFSGLLLILVFGLWLQWFPLSGRLSYTLSYTSWTGFLLLDAVLQRDGALFLSALHHLILPSFALAMVPLSLISRLMRSSLIETLKADYIRTARAKGQSERTIFFKHAFRNALLPVVTMLGFQMSVLLGGAILTENVFSWPGMGRWIVISVEGRDYPAIQGSLLIFIIGIMGVMALTDKIHRSLDPRLKRST